jgi:hypothetical protein
VVFTDSGGTSTGTIGATTDNGNGTYTATFTGVVAGTATTIHATIGGVRVTTTPPTVAVTPGAIAAATSQVTVSAGTVASGAAASLTLQGKDAAGNNVAAGGAAVAFTQRGPGTGTIGAVTDSLNGRYVATFTGVQAGADTIGATIGGVAVTTTLPTLTVTAGAVSATLTTVTAAPGSITASTGASASTITVMARDAASNPVPGVTVSLAASGAGNTITQPVGPTNASGVATGSFASDSAVSHTITATVGGVIATQQPTVLVTPAAASKLAFKVQPSSVVAGAPIAPAVEVRVNDAFDNLVTSATDSVTMAIGTNPGGGALNGLKGARAVAGVATFSSLSIDKVGTGYTLTASSGALAGATSGAFNVTTGVAGKLVFSTQPANTTAGAAFGLTVTAQDTLGNTASGFTGVVRLAITGGTGKTGAALRGMDSVAAVAGVATFSGLSIDSVGSGYTLTASATGTTGGTSAAFNVAAGSATQLAFTTQPAATTAGAGFGVVVAARDAVGNTASGFTGMVRLAINARAGATLRGTDSVAAVAGVATFSGLSVDSAGTGYTLTATATGPAGATSAAFNVAAGAASKLFFTTQPTSRTAGSAFGVVVAARDSLGNTATGFTGSVTVAITAGTGKSGASLLGTTAVAAVAGIATFNGLQIDSAGTNYTLTASATSVVSAISSAFNMTAGAAASLSKLPGGDNVTAPVGTTLGTPHVVRVADALGNPVQGVSITWAADSGGGSVNPITATTDTAGHASTVRTLGPAAGTQTTIAFVTSVTGVVPDTVRFHITATVGGASQMTRFAGDAQVDTVGATLPVALAVKVTDALNNPVSGVTITWTVTGGGGSVSPPTSLSNTSGIATTSWTLGTKRSTPTDSTQTLSASGVGAGANFRATAHPGSVSADSSRVAAAPGSIVAGGAASTVTVTARDGFGNVIASKAVVLAATGTGNTLTQPAGATDVTGIATGSLASTAAGVKTVSATVGGFAVTQTATVTVTAGAASAAKSTVSASSGTVASGGTVTLTLQAKDSSGNNLTNGGLAVVFTASGGTSAGTIGATTDNGNGTYAATFTATTAGTATTIQATIGGVPVTSTLPTVTVTPGAASAATSLVTVSSGTVASGGAVTLTLQARDAEGNNLTTGGAIVAFSFAGGTSTGTIGAVTDSLNGRYVATFTGATAGTATTIHATINATAVTSTLPTVMVSAGAASPSTSTVSVSSGTVASGSAVTLTLQAKDAAGNNLTAGGATVAFSASGGTSTGAIGATTDNLNGTYTATFTGSAAGTATTIHATLNAAAVTSTLPTVTVTAGDPSAATSTVSVSSGTVASGSAVTLTLQAKDAAGNNLTSGGATVTFGASGGTSTGTVGATTDSLNGRYVATFTGVKAGTATTIQATVGGVPVTTTLPTVAVTVGPISTSGSVVSVSSGTVASGSAVTLTLQARDAAGNDLATGGATVAFSASGGTSTGAIGATTDSLNGRYVAAFTGLVAGTATTIHATINAAAVTSVLPTLAVTAGAARQLTFTQQPSAVAAGATMSPAVTVTVEDSVGNLVTAATGTVTLALTTPAGAALTGGGPATVTSGVATFGGLSVDKVGTYTLTPSTTVVGVTTLPASASFAVSAGGATQLVFTQQPSAVVAGATVSPPVTVTVEDAQGNTVTSASGTVTLVLTTPAGATLTGGGPVTVTSGVATFAGLSVNKVGTYTLTPSTSVAGVTTLPASTSFAVSVGAAAQLVFTQQPSAVAAGATMSPPVTVTVEDAQGNVVTAASGTVGLALTTPAGATLTGGGAATVTSGVATFSGLSVDKVGSYTLTPSTTVAGVTTLPASASFAVSAGGATQLVFTQQPSAVAAGATVSPPVMVTVEDAQGNTVTSASGTVTLVLTTPAGATLTGGGAATVTSGVATFAGLSVNKVGSYTLTPGTTVAGVTILPASTSFAVSAGAASQLAFTQQPTDVVAGATMSPPVTVTVEDAQGNTVTTASGTVTLVLTTPAGAILTGGGAATVTAGVATFGTLTVNKVGSYTLTPSTTVSGVTTLPASTAFTVSASTGSQLAFTTEPPASSTAGTGFGVAVTARDSLGNTATSFTGNVTVALTGATGTAGATLRGTKTVAAVAGVATFSGLSVDSVGTGYTLTATATGATNGVSTAFAITAAPASALFFTTQPPASSTAGAAFGATVTARDSLGNTATGFSGNVTVAITGGTGKAGANLRGTKTVAAAAGSATFSGLSVDSSGTGFTLAASASGPTSATSTAFDIVAAPASRLVFTTQPPASSTAGTGFGTTVTARDSLGNTATGFSTGVTVAITGGTGKAGANLRGTATIAAVSGVATFSALSVDSVGSGYTLTASATGPASGTSAAFAITPAPASRLAFTTQPPNTAAGAKFGVAVAARDSLGNPTPAFTDNVTVAITSGTGKPGATLRGTTTVAAIAGVATFSGLSVDSTGTGYTLTAGSGALTAGVSNAFNVIVSAISATLSTVSASSGTITASTGSSASTITVTVKDTLGNPVPGVTVNLAATGSGNTLVQPPAVTDGSGVTAGTFASTQAGPHLVQATAGGVTLNQAPVVTVNPTSAKQLQFSVQPSTVVAGAAITPAVQVQVVDSFTNVVTGSTAPVTVSLFNNPGTSTLGGTLTRNAAAGVATFNNLTLNKVATGYALAATSSGITTGVSNNFDVTPSGATVLVVTAQPPASSIAGTGFGATITARDSLGNTATGFGGNVTFAITGGTGKAGAALRGTTTVAAAAGVATFSGLSVDSVGTGYTLTASAAGPASATTTSFNITPAPASQLVFTTQPPNTTAGAGFGTVVTARDSLGNTATAFTSTVTVAIGTNAGGGTLSGTNGVAAVSGVATFSGLSINKVGTGYTLTASATGPAGATSASFDIGAGAASQLAFTQQPTAVVSGATMLPAVTVMVEDAQGNTVTAASGTVTLALTTPAGATLTGGGATAVTNGVATFGGLSVDKAGTYTLTPSTTVSGVATLPVSTSFAVSAGGATQLVFTQQPTAVVSGATMLPAVTVTVEDAQGNTVTAASGTVTLALTTPAGATLTGGGAAAVTSGVATFSGLSVDKVGTYTFTPSTSVSGVVTLPASGSFAVSPGAASAAQSTASVPAGTAGSPTTVTITVRDANGNVRTATNDAGLLAVNVTGANTATPAVASAGSGTYTATYTPTAAGTDNFAITLSSAGIGGGPYSSVVSPGAASKLAFTQQPSSVISGETMSPPVTVTVEDANGNVVTTASGTVSLTQAPPRGATLTGGGPATVTNGVATFSGLSLNKSGSYTFTPSTTVPGVTTLPSSAGFTVSSGVASQLAFTQQPSAVVAGATMSPAVTVTVEDAQGNTVTTATGTVSLALTTPAGATLTGGGAATVTSGVATFGALSVDKVGSYTLTPSTTVSGVSTLPASSSFAVSIGAASQLVFTQQPSAVVAGATMSPAVAVTVEDAQGNVVTAASGSVTLVLTAPGGATLTGGGPSTVTSGVATFSALSVDKTGTYTLTPSTTVSGVGTLPASGSFAVGAGAASAAQSTASVPAGTAGSPTTVTITVRDANGNVRTATNDAGLLAVNVTGANTATPAVASAGSGTYTASYTPTVTGTDNFAITLSSTGIGGGPYSSVVSPGAISAATSVVTASDSTVPALGSVTLTLQAKDANGNNRTLGGSAVVFTGTGGTSTWTIGATSDNGNGTYTATFTGLTPGSEVTIGATIDGTPVTTTPAPTVRVTL